MEIICDPCSEKNKRLVAEKYCSDCEEKLCTECAEWHMRCKVFRSHHIIDLYSVGSRIPPSSNKNCEIHTDVQIDYFCSQHDVVCCRACLTDSHRSCETVLPALICFIIRDFFSFSNFRFSSLFPSIFCNVSVILSSSSNVSESKDEFLTSFEAESKGKTVSQDL
jgi:hypothetical protein